MKNFVVTIGREFGSGGREIGESLAEKLGFTFYSERLATKASEATGIDEEFFRKVDEKQKKSFWYMFAMSNLLSDDLDTALGLLPTNEKLFIEQTKVIEDLADKEDCVIVGRCSNYILKENPNTLHVFIYSNMHSKIRRIMEKQNMTEAQAKKHISKIEKERKDYYNYYTECKWGDKADYDICLDSSAFSKEEIVDILYTIIQKRIAVLNGTENVDIIETKETKEIKEIKKESKIKEKTKSKGNNKSKNKTKTKKSKK